MSNYSFFVLGSTADPWALISTAHSPLAFDGLTDFDSLDPEDSGQSGYWRGLGEMRGSFKEMSKHISHPIQSADLSSGRINHRRQLKQRRRLVDAAYLGGNWRRRPERKSWDWRGSAGSATAVRESRDDPDLVSPTKISRYYQESIDLTEDSILSDELLEAMSKPLVGSPIRPRHAFATNRVTSRPAGSSQARRRGRVRKINVR